MRRRTVLAIVVGGAAAIDLAIGWASCSPAAAPRDQDVAALAARAVPLDLDAPYSTSSYRFLDAAIGSASIVQLGESLHISAEFPRARLRLVQYLHEQLGFDTLALEGSVTQAWLAEEELRRATDPDRVDRAQERAWFMLWRTPAMREVMAYVAATKATANPLYLTSFDVETGASAAYQEDGDIFADLFDALHGYGPPTDAAREPELRRRLSAITRCLRHPEDGAAAGQAVDELEAWIETVAPRLQPASHAAALAMVPDNLRENIALCVRSAGDMVVWQKTRDELNAGNAVKLRDQLSASHKIITWAHHSHVAYQTTGKGIPSMGQHLRDRLGGAVYTIGTFAGAGSVIDGMMFGERDLPAVSQVGVERMLGAVDLDAYFVDVSRLPTDDAAAGWLVEQMSRYETMSRRPTVLAKDFDGAIYVAHVHPSPIFDSFAIRMLLRIWGLVFTHLVGVAIVILAGLGFGVRAIVRRVLRRLRRARAGAAA